MSKTKLGIRFQEYEKLYCYSSCKKNALHKKGYFWSQKNVFFRNFLFQLFEEGIF